MWSSTTFNAIEVKDAVVVITTQNVVFDNIEVKDAIKATL